MGIDVVTFRQGHNGVLYAFSNLFAAVFTGSVAKRTSSGRLDWLGTTDTSHSISFTVVKCLASIARPASLWARSTVSI